MGRPPQLHPCIVSSVAWPQASPACSPALCPTATHPPPTRRCPTHLQIYGDDLRSMYTYNSSISAQADGRRALCTCELWGGGWAMGEGHGGGGQGLLLLSRMG